MSSFTRRLPSLDLGLPDTICFAGHDAGVLGARIPAAMVLVRNRSGISHSPSERIELEDAEIAADVIERALAQLTSGPTSEPVR